MVEAVADDVDVDAVLQGERGPGVAEAVQWDDRQSPPCRPTLELPRHPVRVQRSTVHGAEHEAVVRPPGAELEPLLARLAAEEGTDAAMLARVLALPVGEDEDKADADDGASLPAPLGSLPAWWGPVIDDEGRRRVVEFPRDAEHRRHQGAFQPDRSGRASRTKSPSGAAST